MPSFLKIWIHFIWSTKHRRAIIRKDLKYQLYEHIRKNAKNKGIYIDYINGTENHIHLLISLKGEQSPSKIAFLLKGESSRWVNINKLTTQKFEWQNEFIALSVSESLVPRLRKYIRNQEKHHRKSSSKAQYNHLLRKYAFDKFEAKAK
jgi:REP element-mobilizing transposase RayT